MLEEKLVEISKLLYFETDKRLIPYGAFHLVWLFLMVLGIALAVYLTIKKPEKTLYFLYILSTIIMWVGEGYKQFEYSFSSGHFYYQWYYFPFQFCSTPLYTFLLCAICKKGKVYDAVSVYNATYSLFAGTMVMLAPSSVLYYSYGIAVQSLLHHVLMVITGVSALVVYSKKMNIKLFLQSMIVFIALLCIAEILNFGLPIWSGQEINMYFISKSYSGSNPLGIFQQAYPYPVFIAMYFSVFSEVACGIAYFAHKVACRK